MGPVQAELKPETPNSFWAFDEADGLSIERSVLERWFARHDHAYLATRRALLRAAASAQAACGEDRFGGLRACLASAGAAERLRAGFERRMLGR